VQANTSLLTDSGYWLPARPVEHQLQHILQALTGQATQQAIGSRMSKFALCTMVGI